MEPTKPKSVSDLKAKFETLNNFLTKYEKMLKNLPLRSYPNHLDGYEKEWIEEFRKKDMAFLDSVENKRSCIQIENQSLKDFI